MPSKSSSKEGFSIRGFFQTSSLREATTWTGLVKSSADDTDNRSDPTKKEKSTNGSSKANRKNQKTSVPTNIKDIEKIIGFVSEQYDCEHNNFAGTLYAGPLAVAWLGRVFFFEWTVVIKWEDVVQVQQQENGIRFHNRAKATYDFVKVFNPEKAWSTLVSLHNDSVIDMPRNPTPRQVTRGLRRMNSDPLKVSLPIPVDQFDNTGETSLQLSPSTRKRRTRESILRKSASVPIGYDEIKSTLGHSDDSTTIDDQWAAVADTCYTEIATEKQELRCDFETFLDMFIRDDAQYSIPAFMSKSGDEEIKCSPWKEVDSNSPIKTRTIEYTHPINAPMAPPMARARKEQTYKKFGKTGLILETRTYVSDVPMTDCFYVADQIRVEAVDEKTVSITMSFQLEFVKSTMFKAIIVRTTTGEFQSFMQRLVNYMSENLGQKATTAPLPPNPVPVRAGIGKFTLLVAGLISVLMIMIQIWILIDIRNVKQALLELQECQVR